MIENRRLFSAQELVEILSELGRDPIGPVPAILEFQQLVWNTVSFESISPEAKEILIDIADTLDYYEPDPRIRQEDPSYFGEERLRKEICTALALLKTALPPIGEGTSTVQ